MREAREEREGASEEGTMWVPVGMVLFGRFDAQRPHEVCQSPDSSQAGELKHVEGGTEVRAEKTFEEMTIKTNSVSDAGSPAESRFSQNRSACTRFHVTSASRTIVKPAADSNSLTAATDA